jgi:hypothetical protein
LVGSLRGGGGEPVYFVLMGSLNALAAANGVWFWLGKPFARWGAVAVVLALMAVQLVAQARDPLTLAGVVVLWSLPLVVLTNVFLNWRTRLFFKLPVSRGRLQQAWDLLHNNSLARQSALAGFVGLAIPGFGLIALAMGVIALRRVDPTAYPPIGKKGFAIAGMVLGAVGALGWAALLLSLYVL